jgi:hypothetical protein
LFGNWNPEAKYITMSTMLRSAAMTLLSKTLLTFLYKYLSDVDVEGVEMPSLYGSSEGQTSGWGVRLSNVKLREGAELMQLPGGKKTKSKNEGESPKSSEEKDDATATERAGNDHPCDESEGSLAGDLSIGGNSLQRKSNAIPINDAEDMSFSTLDRHLLPRTPPSEEMVPKTEADKGDFTLETEADHDSDSETLDSLAEGRRPETPVQHSSLSYLYCLNPGSGNDNKIKDGKPGVQQEQQAHGVPLTPSREETEDRNIHYRESRHPVMNGDSSAAFPTSNGGNDMRNQTDVEEGKESGSKNTEQGKEESGLDEEEEETESTTPMVLRIGEGGYIGTLDVR